MTVTNIQAKPVHQPWLLLYLLTLVGCSPKPEQLTLMECLRALKSRQFVDLTHAFEPGIPHWHGFPDEQRETIYWYEQGGGSMGTGFFAQRYSLVGQWGTHVDPPAHFTPGLSTKSDRP